jgi:hypothetical protein
MKQYTENYQLQQNEYLLKIEHSTYHSTMDIADSIF